MTDHDDISTLHHHSDTPVNFDSNSGGSHDPPRSKPAIQKRTRSQHDVSDSILRLPLSRSPFKDARKAHVEARRASPLLQVDSHLPRMDCEAMARTGATKAIHRIEEGTEMGDYANERLQQCWEEEGSQDSLFSPPISGGKACDEDTATWPTTTGKRTSPDTDPMRALSSPGSERQSKRAKLDGLEEFRFPGHRQGHPEYHEPLRDHDTRTPRGHRRTSSTKQTPSPRKLPSSLFHRAQSVPLGGEMEVRAIDFTIIPPSPRRSPNKGAVEIRRALSVPPPDDEQMDIDAAGDSGLLHFTNSTLFATPRANPVLHCTVNFATPCGPTTLRPGSRSATPLSPLTPIPSPLTERLPMQPFSAKTNSKSLARRDRTISTSHIYDAPMAGTAISIDTSQSAARILSQPSSPISMSHPRSADALHSPPLVRSPSTSRNSMELIPPPPAVMQENSPERALFVPEGPSQAEDMTSNNTVDLGGSFTDDSELSSPPSSPPSSNVPPISRPSITDTLSRKRGYSIPQGPRRVTRSVSSKVERVKGGPSEIKNSLITGDADQAYAMSKQSAPLAEVTSEPRPPKPTGATSKSKLPPPTRRSISASNPPPDTGKLKQTSLNIFMKAKPPTGVGGSTVHAHTSSGGSSGLVSLSSPSKIPLPTPSKRPSTTQLGSTKPFLFSLGSPSTGTGTARGTSGRSLTTLSHALDKLVVPPPTRPNTSMGFVREDGQSEEGTIENGKAKGKAKDDASVLPASSTRRPATTFARPTASSLNRAATVSAIGSTTTPKMRTGATVRGMGKGRGVIGIFGRAGDRASKKTSLPVVVGSPVKGSGGKDDLHEDALGTGKHKLALTFGGAEDTGGVSSRDDVTSSAVVGEKPEQDTVVRVRKESNVARKLPPLAATIASVVDIDMTAPISIEKGKQRALAPSTLNPASSALHALSESLSSLPQTPTPPKPRAVGTRTGLRSSTAGTGKESPILNGSSSAGPSRNSEIHGGSSAGPGIGPANGSDSAKKSSLKILKRCVIFVDVRTEQGDDAGSLFVDMLKGLGAKIMSRIGRKCTHIVYKNGLPATLTRYRLLDDPKPIVVGIAWVVECVEKRAKVDEERFKIDVDMINVAGGTHKLRRSMLPKHLVPASPGPESELSMHVSSEVDEDDGRGSIDGSSYQDPDVSIRSREEDDLPPLERARRRRSILPGGQTRLIP